MGEPVVVQFYDSVSGSDKTVNVYDPLPVSVMGGAVTITPSGTSTVTGSVTALPSGTTTVTGSVSVSGTVTASPSGTTTVSGTVTLGSGTAAVGGTLLAPAITNPVSTIQGTAQTTVYGANTFIANSSVAGSVTVPSFTLPNSGGVMARVEISNNDTVTTSWNGQTVQLDMWRVAPTLAAGDRGAWSITGGSGNHLASFTGTFGTEEGDGYYCTATINMPPFVAIKLAGSATAVFWTLEAVSGSGVTGANVVWTVIPEIIG